MHSPIQTYLAELHGRLADLHEGKLADYIPELAKADPKCFGICLVTMDGVAYTVGDTDSMFTMQSISKPFVFATALADRGLHVMAGKVGVEPSGDAFNSIELEPKTMRPYNAMINAGAIAIASMIKKDSRESGVREFVDKMSLAAGRELRVDQSVYASEDATGNRNRAIAYLMLNCGIIDAGVEHTLHQYFSQCSLLVTAQDLAMMSATLANMGANPVTQERVFDFNFIKDTLTVMFTCGLYDHAGEWATV